MRFMNRAAYDKARGETPSWRVAAEIGIPAPYLSKIVAGKVNPGVRLVRKLADYLNVSIDELYPPDRVNPPPRRRRVVTAAEAGRRGAEARKAKLTPEARSEAARKAARARWGESPAYGANPMSGRHHPWMRGAGHAANDAWAYREAA